MTLQLNFLLSGLKHYVYFMSVAPFNHCTVKTFVPQLFLLVFSCNAVKVLRRPLRNVSRLFSEAATGGVL